MKEQIEEMVKDLDAIYSTDFKDDYESGLMDIAERLYNAGYRKQEWIRLKDRLPEKGDFYLVSMIDHFGLDCVTVLPYTERFGFGGYEVTHWMPFPEPPKKGGAE